MIVVLKVSGQSNDTVNTNVKNNEIWIDFYLHYYINEKIEYYGDAGYRTIAGEQSWNRIYARPSLKYHFNSLWEAQVGLGFFFIFLNDNNFNRFELTPWQGVQLNWPNFGYVDFKSLVKIEERFSFSTNDGSSSLGARIQFGLIFIKTGKIAKEKGKLYSKLFDYRQKGDYGDLFDYDEELVRPLIEQVKDFIKEIETYIIPATNN